MSTTSSDDAHRFCYRDEEMKLLETGEFSDAKVAVGDRVWKVHRSIVCPRSKFLRHALSRPRTIANLCGHTEEQVEVFLEFLYSGSIKSIDEFGLKDCVQLQLLAQKLGAPDLWHYAEETLWNKLKSILRAVWAIPEARNTYEHSKAIDAKLSELDFWFQFGGAVDRACFDQRAETCQIIFADFVWAARDWIISDCDFQELQQNQPAFGSRVLTTIGHGPQSLVVLCDTKFMSNANLTTLTWCTKCTQAEDPN